MQQMSFGAVVLLLCSVGSTRAVPTEAVSGPYDGEWSVVLVCPDTQDKSGLVKGYAFTFAVTITDGKVQGQYGAKGAPASVVYTGEVRADGSLEIRATGNTRLSDRTVGKVGQGTPYSYSMTGMLEQSQGQATRRELRPCTATFARR